MAVTINGTSGISGVDGSVGTPAVQGTDGNTGMFFPAADTIAFAEGGAEVMRIDSSSNLQFNSGYGSVATAYGCRAWVNFNGTGTVAIRASGNVTSITDNGTGDYTVNFTTAMPDANYATTALSSGKSGTEATGIISIEWTTVPSTTVVRIATINRSAGTATDNTYNNVAIFR